MTTGHYRATHRRTGARVTVEIVEAVGGTLWVYMPGSWIGVRLIDWIGEWCEIEAVTNARR